MRGRNWIIAGVAAIALGCAGLAVADGTLLAQTTSSATASATTVSDLKTSTCTNKNGTFESTRGHYTGSASGALFSGSLHISAHSLVNTGNGVGRIVGGFTVGQTRGDLRGVLVNGTLSGWIEGHGPNGKFVGTFSGTWDKKTGFGSLSIGTSSASNLLVLATGSCRSDHDDQD